MARPVLFLTGNLANITTTNAEDGTIVWETEFRVEGAPALGPSPIRRFMANSGTFAAYSGGQPVVIEQA